MRAREDRRRIGLWMGEGVVTNSFEKIDLSFKGFIFS
jgi:hypothetical protein